MTRGKWLTEAFFRVAPALSFRVDLALRAVLEQILRRQAPNGTEKSAYHEWIVEVSNLIEKMDLILARKQCGTNTVHWRVTPTLLKESRHSRCAASLGSAASPHNRTRPSRPKTLRTSRRPRPSRSQGHRSQSYSRLAREIGQIQTSLGDKEARPYSGNGCKSLHRHQK